MSEEFRSFAQLLAAPPKPPAPPPPDEAVPAPQEPTALLRDVRLFRARLRERLNDALPMLLEDIAADVLARELALAPCDIAALCERALEQFAYEEPLAIRVHPQDAACIGAGVPVHADPEMRRGDAIVELRDGIADASLGARLMHVLEAFDS